jgi:mRNA-degrading endonuclease toxin of MazEF toxin-antitoxin module
VIASVDARNRHERADTVLVAPLATSIHRDSPVQVLLAAGETGLASDSAARGDSITVVYKQDLAAPRGPLRRLSNTGICELATKVNVAMSCVLCHARDSDF